MDQIGQTGAVSRLLKAWGRGDLQARDDLMPVVYRELRRRAGAYLRRERQDHTLQPTALVHEAFMRLVGQERVAWQNRAHFFAIASHMMRRILVDYAREHQAAKRPGAGVKVMLDDRIGAAPATRVRVSSISIRRSSSSRASIPGRVRLSSFGISAACRSRKSAEVLSISRATVTREWQTARAWLYRRMTTGPVGKHA